MLRLIAIALFLLWLAVDSWIVFQRTSEKGQDRDGKTLSVIMAGNAVAWTVGITVAFSRFGQIPNATLLQIVGLMVLAGGIAVRLIAVHQLGRFHTPNVAILDRHDVFDSGLYSYVRHPSYLGALLSFVGLGIALGNWISIIVFVAITVPIYLIRIRQEEAALAEGLADAYAAYCSRTKRLIPKVY